MKVFFIFILLLLSISTNCQKVYRPSWSEKSIAFETAKMVVYSNATKKMGPEKFKTSKINIESQWESTKIQIDIPDIIYVPLTNINTCSYEKEQNGSETLTYTILTDNSLVVIGFIFSVDLSVNFDKPSAISVVITDRKSRKSSPVYMLTEFKEKL